jgi:hypothetical protein
MANRRFAMPEWKLTKKDIKALAKQVKEDQSKTTPAEKRVKLSMTFNQAMKKMARSSSPKKK